MRKLLLASRWGALTVVGGAIAIGVAALAASEVNARKPPQPDCGPTREWNCVLPRCEECPEILFVGTVCEKAAFERQTGRVCS